MKPLIYVETTIPSYYCNARPELAGDIARTRTWWDEERVLYECFVSAVVLDELAAGDYPTKPACLALVAGLPLVDVSDEAMEVAEVYRARGVMPREPAADALHVALASVYRMDYLLTWNCRHLANVHKERRLEELNSRMSLVTPRLITAHLILPWEGMS